MKKIFLLTLIFTLSACANKYNQEGENSDTATGGVDVNDNGNLYDSDIYGGGSGGSGDSSIYSGTDDSYSISGATGTRGNRASNRAASYGDYYSDSDYGVNVVGGPSSGAKDRLIYFAFDSYDLDSRSMAVLRVHAKYLREHSDVNVVLEGHTDERGCREYNVGLGERRAYAVRNQFINEGVSSEQIRVLSYGEERPASDCSSEQCYARNRRVVIVY